MSKYGKSYENIQQIGPIPWNKKGLPKNAMLNRNLKRRWKGRVFKEMATVSAKPLRTESTVPIGDWKNFTMASVGW
jgi:hypothetical protein